MFWLEKDSFSCTPLLIEYKSKQFLRMISFENPPNFYKKNYKVYKTVTFVYNLTSVIWVEINVWCILDDSF